MVFDVWNRNLCAKIETHKKNFFYVDLGNYSLCYVGKILPRPFSIVARVIWTAATLSCVIPYFHYTAHFVNIFASNTGIFIYPRFFLSKQQVIHIVTKGVQIHLPPIDFHLWHEYAAQVLLSSEEMIITIINIMNGKNVDVENAISSLDD